MKSADEFNEPAYDQIIVAHVEDCKELANDEFFVESLHNENNESDCSREREKCRVEEEKRMLVVILDENSNKGCNGHWEVSLE